MVFLYNKSVTGYNHKKVGSICQDYSDSFYDGKFQIITACDGHGGNIYFRSDVGSKLASDSIMIVFSKYNERKIEQMILNKNFDKLKLDILCMWNILVEQHYNLNKFSEEELFNLDEEDIRRLEKNYTIAYGSTLNAVVVTNKYLICIQVGDGGIFLLKNKKADIAFLDNDENVANITQSLCGDDVFNHLYITTYEKSKYLGAIICTDGLLTPYKTLNNFHENFILPYIENFKIINKESIKRMDEFIEKLGNEDGVGDDVTLSSVLY